LSQGCSAHKKVFDYYFDELEIKGRGAGGNIVTKYPVRKVTQKEVGKSSLGAQKLWMDKVSGRLNAEDRGIFLGDFDTGDSIFALYKNGTYEVVDFDMTKRFEPKELLHIGKLDPSLVVSAVYYDGNKKWTMVKRFNIETTSNNQVFNFMTDHKMTKLLFASVKENPRIEYGYKVKSKKMTGEVSLAEFIDVKGWKALGNKLSDQKLTGVKEVDASNKEKLSPGDSIEFDVDKKDKGQGELF